MCDVEIPYPVISRFTGLFNYLCNMEKLGNLVDFTVLKF